MFVSALLEQRSIGQCAGLNALIGRSGKTTSPFCPVAPLVLQPLSCAIQQAPIQWTSSQDEIVTQSGSLCFLASTLRFSWASRTRCSQRLPPGNLHYRSRVAERSHLNINTRAPEQQSLSVKAFPESPPHLQRAPEANKRSDDSIRCRPPAAAPVSLSLY